MVELGLLFINTGGMNTYPSPLLKKQCDSFKQQQGQGQIHEVVYEAAKRSPVQLYR